MGGPSHDVEPTLKLLVALPYIPSLIRVRPYQFIRELARRHEVHVLATQPNWTQEDVSELLLLCQSVDVVPLRWAASARSCVGAVLRGDPLQAAICQSPRLERHLRDLLSVRDFDLVHIEHLRAAGLGMIVPEDVPTVYDAVDSISLLLQRTLRSSHSLRQRVVARLELRRTRAFEARVLTQFDATIVTSPEDAQMLHALAPSASLTVVPNGVDLDYFRPLGGARDPLTLVFSGKMSYHANVTAVLHFVQRIFPLIRATHPGARLRIVGSDPPRVVRALAADPSISVTGHVPELRAYLGRATVAVCPVTVKVGIQNKLLEAMAMGVPAVSTREGAAGLGAVAARDLLVADTPSQFADHVRRLFDDELFAAHIALSGRRYVERHHRWQDAGSRLESVYQQAIEHRRGRLKQLCCRTA